MSTSHESAAHWDATYALGESTRSWFQDRPDQSLRLLDVAEVPPRASIIDVGGGASTLAGALLDRGGTDITVLDISATGLAHARERLGAQAGHVHWIQADVLTWQPERTYHAWHDRALFHFLTTDQAQRQYLLTMDAATTPGSVAVFGCFAPDGPHQCSGLPVTCYGVDDLATRLGRHWKPIEDDREEHHTPDGTPQPFTWAAFRRQP
ncbi:MAG: class I SAM-dependent methyltransferase [Actinomycetes bacterium]